MWLEMIGLSHWEAARILMMSRKAEDHWNVQRATIARVDGDVATVERWSWGGNRLLDYPVALAARGEKPA